MQYPDAYYEFETCDGYPSHTAQYAVVTCNSGFEADRQEFLGLGGAFEYAQVTMEDEYAFSDPHSGESSVRLERVYPPAILREWEVVTFYYFPLA